MEKEMCRANIKQWILEWAKENPYEECRGFESYVYELLNEMPDEDSIPISFIKSFFSEDVETFRRLLLSAREWKDSFR